MNMDIAEGQKLLEEHIEKTLRENNVDQKDTMNGMMKSRAGECSYKDRSLTFEFPVQPWQANRAGQIHGGMICTAFDITMAALARFYAGENFAPTVSLDVRYVRPVMIGDVLIVKVTATATGRRITQLTGEAYSKDTGKLSATASSVFLNVDTVNERTANG